MAENSALLLPALALTIFIETGGSLAAGLPAEDGNSRGYLRKRHHQPGAELFFAAQRRIWRSSGYSPAGFVSGSGDSTTNKIQQIKR